MKMTIRRLAEQAGVSRGTVDKVLHGRRGVSDQVRERIEKLVAESGYTLPPRERIAPLEERHRTVAAILPRLTNPFFASAKRGMDDTLAAYAERNVDVEYFYCDSANVTELLSLLDDIEQRGVEGLVLRGVESQRLRDRLGGLDAKGTPVVLFDSDVPGSKRLCMVGEDSRVSGRVAASLLAKSIGGAGEVAVIGGLPDIAVHRARLMGFEDVIRERYPNIRIVEVIYSRDQSVIAYEKTGILLGQHPRLRGIFSVVGCTGDIGQALIDNRAQHVKMVSYNFTPDIVALVKRGIVDFTIGLTPYRQGASALKTMLDYVLDGIKPAAPFLEMPILIGIEENIELLARQQNI